VAADLHRSAAVFFRLYNERMAFRPQSSPQSKKGRTPPPEETYEEVAYLKALGEKQKLVSIKLVHGEMVRGWIEYYDRNMVRLTREGAPNLFIFKHEIMYISEGASKEPQRKPRHEPAPGNSSSDGGK
jgi:host factor-I protein